jgi:hypothetical protein
MAHILLLKRYKFSDTDGLYLLVIENLINLFFSNFFSHNDRQYPRF